MKDLRRLPLSQVKGPTGVDGVRPGDRQDIDEREAARAFQQALRHEYLDHHLVKRRARDVVVGFEERVIVSGERAAETMSYLEDLVRISPTFRGVMDASLAQNDTIWIRVGWGGGYSWATIGAQDEKVYINLEQGDLLDLLIHECGHALAKLEDGPLGGFGPNQRFQAVVKREMEMAGAELKAYGLEVRQEPGPMREG
ncbi:hypothetical protein [Salinarimonas ramus]|uniref:Uncharacterized protein n=1 Tax=Salinarimonas ramus TaxID=690164 RepID=A0A917V2N6_9HYPH|nr:hypothetical protein [Salinarimonas ramus]GGK25505.1 hypothetical protein GCM10011322_10080 [Salinarimonas ramus]